MSDLRAEAVDLPNPWAIDASHNPHVCYFCKPDAYPPMLKEHTICARCAALIVTPGFDDPMNESMFLCPPCDYAMSNPDE